MSGSWQSGRVTITYVGGGGFRLDGGAMFGIIPKPLWEKKAPPDERNRIQLAANCLLVDKDGKRILLDTGYGGKHEERFRSHNDLERGSPILNNLRAVGVAPEEIDYVIFTHLHFDHAGGGTVRTEEGEVRPAFPNAVYVVQQEEWEDATSEAPEFAGAYFLEDCQPLLASGQLRLARGDEEILPGIRVQKTGGHTRGHQLIRIDCGECQAIYTGDLCPTSAHLRTFWAMGYDLFQLDVRRLKPRLLGEIADGNHVILFDHDPAIRGAYLARDPRDGFLVRERISL